MLLKTLQLILFKTLNCKNWFHVKSECIKVLQVLEFSRCVCRGKLCLISRKIILKNLPVKVLVCATHFFFVLVRIRIVFFPLCQLIRFQPFYPFIDLISRRQLHVWIWICWHPATMALNLPWDFDQLTIHSIHYFLFQMFLKFHILVYFFAFLLLFWQPAGRSLHNRLALVVLEATRAR